jgi:hypothetical protein
MPGSRGRKGRTPLEDMVSTARNSIGQQVGMGRWRMLMGHGNIFRGQLGTQILRASPRCRIKIPCKFEDTVTIGIWLCIASLPHNDAL